MTDTDFHDYKPRFGGVFFGMKSLRCDCSWPIAADRTKHPRPRRTPAVMIAEKTPDLVLQDAGA